MTRGLGLEPPTRQIHRLRLRLNSPLPGRLLVLANGAPDYGHRLHRDGSGADTQKFADGADDDAGEKTQRAGDEDAQERALVGLRSEDDRAAEAEGKADGADDEAVGEDAGWTDFALDNRLGR